MLQEQAAWNSQSNLLMERVYKTQYGLFPASFQFPVESIIYSPGSFWLLYPFGRSKGYSSYLKKIDNIPESATCSSKSNDNSCTSYIYTHVLNSVKYHDLSFVWGLKNKNWFSNTKEIVSISCVFYPTIWDPSGYLYWCFIFNFVSKISVS